MEKAPSDSLPRAPQGDQTVTRLQATRGLGRMLVPRELWRYRDLARQFAIRDITVRYRQTALGAAWAVLQPVGLMLVFTIFFGHVAHVSSGGVPYWLFSLSGLVPWMFFANTVTVGSDSLVNNAQMVAKIYFPRIFLPMATMAASLVDLAISFTILVVVVFVTGRTPGLGVLALPLVFAIAVATALGVTALFAAVNVRYRDVRYAVPFIIQFWLFATPIAYSTLLLHSPWRTLSALNPMVGVVQGLRWAMLQTPAPWTQLAVFRRRRSLVPRRRPGLLQPSRALLRRHRVRR